MNERKTRRRLRPVTSTSTSTSTSIPIDASEGQAPKAMATPGRRVWIFGVVPALAAVVAFAPCWRNGFVDWDDFVNITTNPNLRGPAGLQLRWAWSTFHLGVYQPLSWMLLEAEHALWGLDPRGYHLTSLALACIAAVVLDALSVALLTRCRPGCEPWRIHLAAALAVALFVAHPLRTEVVAWVSCQPYLPCAIFAMLAVLAYLRAHPATGPTRTGWVVGSWLLFAAALLSKAVAVTLPLILLIVDAYPLRRFGGAGRLRGLLAGPAARWVWLEKLPFVALGLVFMSVAVQAKRAFVMAFGVVIDQGPLKERVAQSCYSACFYLARTAWPARISAYYPLPRRVEWSDPRFFLSGVAVLGLTAAAIHLRRRHPGLLAAWLSYLVILAPNAGLMRIGGQIAADRYSYLSMMGIVVLVAGGLSGLLTTRGRAAMVVATALVVVAALTVASRVRCRTWLDSIGLWTDALSVADAPDPVLEYYLGNSLVEGGDVGAGLEHYARSLRLHPRFPEARRRMGLALLSVGRLDEAEPYLAEAAGLRPRDPALSAGYGRLLLLRGRLAEAERELTEAVRLRPDEAGFRDNLGLVLLHQGKLDEAAGQFEREWELQPDGPDALINLGTVRGRQGKLDEALTLFQEALRKHPDHLDARRNLGVALFQKGRLAEAEGVFQEVLRRQPGDTTARDALAEIARARGR
jgi:tetratricopeptide (TPR) repeat protein